LSYVASGDAHSLRRSVLRELERELLVRFMEIGLLTNDLSAGFLDAQQAALEGLGQNLAAARASAPGSDTSALLNYAARVVCACARLQIRPQSARLSGLAAEVSDLLSDSKIASNAVFPYDRARFLSLRSAALGE
jgi:hypothetical protein